MKRAFIAAAFISIILLASTMPAAALASPEPALLLDTGKTDAKQDSSYNLSLSVPIYYVQESGDVILFLFVAVDSAGTKVAVAFGNGTTGWHFSGSAAWTQDYFDPRASMEAKGEGYLIMAALLMKNVWPSGWRVVDQCFGMVPKFDSGTSMPYAVTFNQDFRMILIYNVEANASA